MAPLNETAQQKLVRLRRSLEDLKEARRSGVKRSIFNERDTTFKSDEDMRAAQRELEKEIADMEDAEGPRRRFRSRVIRTTFRSRYDR